MKYELHIPVEQYGFVSAELETEFVAEVAQVYNEISLSFKEDKSGAGLEKKDYDGFIDRLMSGGSIHISDYEKMSSEQQTGCQLIKRSQARIKRLMDKQGEALDYPS